GNRNTGDCNTGDWNTGNRNTGDCNTGDWNTGNRNTGDWNTCTGAAGCFCTEHLTIPMFNKPSDMTLRDWWGCNARRYLNEIPKDVVEWICADDMTEQEKSDHPTYKTTGGYLKILDEKDNAQNWWNNAAQYKRDAIMALPNFDAAIFKECTGIDIDGVKRNERTD
ncbi:MAG: pentapeptide repeat-containing protein, partial [Oscillospiraceae bacterium]|nr:pentapeptide repeat-containing protein [Oscillospiraceae bacterium]